MTPSPTHEEESWQEKFQALPNKYKVFMKPFIDSLLAAEERKVRENLRDWVEMMWNFDEFDHDDWTGSDEVLASIQSYLEGKHNQ